MRTEHLPALLLMLLPLAFCSCTSRSEASPSTPMDVALAPTESARPTAVVKEPETRTKIEVHFGLHSGISAADMGEIVTRIRKEWRFCGQGCGMAPDENGKGCGAFWDYFVSKSPEEESAGITLGYLQNETGLNSVGGDGFEYRLRQGFFHRKDRHRRPSDVSP